MTDRAFEDNNPFEQIYGQPAEKPAEDDPFAAIYGGGPESGTSAAGAFGRGVAKGALPAIGSLPAMGAGAELGGAAGFAVGGPFGAAVGALGGGIAGAIGGGAAVSAAQHYVLSKLPDSWTEALGMSDRQEKLDQEYHGTASFLGGLAPFAMTMRPGAIARANLPANSTALQRIMANPATARVFGGAAMGGMEAGQELAEGEPSPDWTKVAISTGFGVVFNKPTRIGEAITEMGAHPARRALGLAEAPRSAPSPTTPAPEETATEAPPATRTGIAPSLFHAPTVADAADLGIMGPGHTEQTFQGSHEPDEAAVAAARETKRTEQAVIGPSPAPDVHSVARQMDFETFAEYERLKERRQTLAAEPGAAAHLAATEAELERLEPQVQAAYRRASEFTGTEVEAPAEASAAPGGPETARSIEDQRDYIVQDAKRQLKAAGRPEDEAAAVAQLIAARYEARASGMNGALGTAEELYDREAAEIRGQQIRAKVKSPAGRAALEGFQERMAQGKEAALKRRNEGGGGPQFGSRSEQMREEARASTPQAVWDDLAAKRQERNQNKPIETAYNAATTKGGAAVRGKATQVWEPGNTVDVGIVKNLLIAEKNADGSFTLLAKPDKEGMSQSYNAAPQKGLVREEKVKFLDKTRAIREPTPEEMFLEDQKATREAYEDSIEGLEPEERAGAREEFTQDDAKELHQATLGKINLNPKGISGKDYTGAEGVRPVLTLMKNANASTAVHELGHEWLAQMLRDAEHEKAPEGLKADRDTLLKWFGIEKTEDIATKHHEKFARGFEQYLREGHAPTRALANVFAKFKAWLTQIYQSLKGLGQPINDDIRKVFDRLLVAEPRATVIAGERAHQPTLPAIHAADAEHTPPHEADAARDRVYTEAEQYYTDNPHAPEYETAEEEQYAAERAAAQLGAEARAGFSGSGEVQQASAGTQSGGGGVEAQHAQERAGGAGAQPQGAGVREAASGSGGREESKSVPLAGSPAPDLTITGQSFNVGKDGNVRAENITSVEQFREAINESSDRIATGNDDILTMGQMEGLANDLGLDAKTLDANRIAGLFGGLHNIAAKIRAFREVVLTQSKTVHDLMRNVQESGSDAATAEFAKEAARLDMFVSALSSVTTEMGRGLGMGFRNLEGWKQAKDLNEFLKANTGKTLFQLKMVAKLGSQLDSPAKVARFLRDSQKRSFGGMVVEYWINGLISGIATHSTYMLGNSILTAEKLGPETAAAAMIGAARRAMGRQGDTVRFGEVGAHFKGVARGLPASLQAATEGFRTGLTTLLPGETARPLIPFAGDTNLTFGRTIGNQPVSWGEAGSDLFSMVRGMRDGIVSGAALIKAGGQAGAPAVGFAYSPLGQIPDIAFRGVPAIPVGSAIRLPGRFIAAIHSFFRTTNYSAYRAGGAYRAAIQAAEEAKAQGRAFSGADFDAATATAWLNPSAAQMEAYRHEATETALMGHAGKFTENLQKLTNTEVNLPLVGGVRLLKFVDPFVHISSNIIKQTVVQRTPLGLISSELRADLSGKNGTIAQDTATARMLVGSALSITFGGLAAEGYVTGSGPSDPHEAAMWREVYQPHSVRVGDLWYQVNRLGPVGMLMGIAADLYAVAHDAVEGDVLKAAAHLQHAFTQNILDESFMRGPADLIKAVEDPGRYGEGYIKNFLSSFVPYSVGVAQMSRAADPYSRQARNVMDAIIAKTPWSQDLHPRINVWGEPVPNLPALGGRAVSAIYMQQVNSDPVNQAMMEVGIFPGAVERKIRNVELTDQQYEDFARLAGRMTKQRLDIIVRSPDWQTWANHTRHDVFKAVIDQSREAARGMTMAKYPQIPHDAAMAKIKRVTGP